MNFRANRILAAALLASSCGLAIGATKTTTFAVTATVVSNCFINSASAMAFGSYTPGTTVGSANVDQTSTILVRCSNTTPYGIGLDAGNATDSTFAPRLLKSATATTSTLEYNLYTDAGRTVTWVNPSTAAAATGNQGGTGSGLGTVITHTVYGRLLDSTTSQEAVPATDYTSTVTVTINY
jgi:spore coat protein U-like protein